VLFISKDDWNQVVQAPSHLSRSAASSLLHRDLNFSLQLDLLIRLQRAKAPLDAMLLHPKTSGALFDYVHRESKGGLRPIVYHLTFDILQRVVVFLGQHLSPETTNEVSLFLTDQVAVLAQLLRTTPCPASDEVSEEDEHEGRVPEGLRESLTATGELERDLCTLVDRRSLSPADIKVALELLAKEYTVMLQRGYQRWQMSMECDELLTAMGAYLEDVVSRVDAVDIVEICNKVVSNTVAERRTMVVPPTVRLGSAPPSKPAQIITWSSPSQGGSSSGDNGAGTSSDSSGGDGASSNAAGPSTQGVGSLSSRSPMDAPRVEPSRPMTPPVSRRSMPDASLSMRLFQGSSTPAIAAKATTERRARHSMPAPRMLSTVPEDPGGHYSSALEA